MTDYRALTAGLRSLISGIPYLTAVLANAASLIYHSMENVNWVGFYLLEGDRLILGPFQGKPACIEIPVGRGVCGAAVSEQKTQLVRDVHEFPGHIACDAESASELVTPIFAGGRCVGVLDADSPLTARFDESDAIGFRALVSVLEREAGHLFRTEG